MTITMHGLMLIAITDKEKLHIVLNSTQQNVIKVNGTGKTKHKAKVSAVIM